MNVPKWGGAVSQRHCSWRIRVVEPPQAGQALGDRAAIHTAGPAVTTYLRRTCMRMLGPREEEQGTCPWPLLQHQGFYPEDSVGWGSCACLSHSSLESGTTLGAPGRRG